VCCEAVGVDGKRIAERFGLGRLVGEPVEAATGWGGRNRVWRLDTMEGTFAVKDTIEELLPADPGESLRIERCAFEGGVPAAVPLPSTTGASYEPLDGRWYRCHRWIDGTAKQNEETTTNDARQMGAVVAQLHRLAVPVVPLQEQPASPFGRSHWRRLAGRRPEATWARLIRDDLDAIVRADAFAASAGDACEVGSHRDLNAHNVLFTAHGLVLIDWDAAGPISISYERGMTATLWAQREQGRLDLEAATPFLCGYQDAGGLVELDDVGELPRWLGALSWWTERNVQIAVTHPSNHHDELARGLVAALAQGEENIEERQQFLAEAIARLWHSELPRSPTLHVSGRLESPRPGVTGRGSPRLPDADIGYVGVVVSRRFRQTRLRSRWLATASPSRWRRAARG
jgi:Ser/Thr protein kinase RdoA (MazF antagonist)